MDSHITVTGYVGSDVAHRTVQEYTFASFRLASTPRIRRHGEWQDAATTWFSVSCARALADHVRDSLAKGDAVVVHGKLRTEQWTDSTGVEQQRIAIDALTVGHDLARGTSSWRKAERFVEGTTELGHDVGCVDDSPADEVMSVA